MVDPRTKRRRRRRVRRLAAALVLLIAATAGAAIWWRVPLAQTLLGAALERAGLGGVRFAVSRVTADGAVIDDVRWGDAIAVPSIRLKWAIPTLFSRPVSRMTVAGGRIDAGALAAAFRPPPASEASPAAIVPDVERFPTIVLQDVTVVFQWPGGGELPVIIEGIVAPSAVPQGFAGEARVAGAAPRLALGGVVVENVRVNGSLAVTVSDGVFTMTLPEQLVTTADRVRHGKATVAPLALSLGSAGPPALRIDLAAADVLPSIAAEAVIKADPLMLRLDDGTPVSEPLAVDGTVGLSAGAVRFDGRATGAGGGLAVRVAWDLRSAQGSAKVHVDGIGFADPASGVKIEALAGALAFDRLTPPVTPPGQELRAHRIEAWLPLDAPTLRFHLSADPEGRSIAVIESFRAGVMGGRLSIDDGWLKDGGDAALTLDVAGVELAPILALLGAEGIGGTGALEGRLPVVLEGGRMAVADARLVAREPGTLRIRSDAARRVLSGRAEEIDRMLQALEDFRYERLSLAIDKPPHGGGRIRLETLGHNPAVLGGRSFEITLNLEGDFDRLLRVLVEAARLPGQIIGIMLREPR